MSNNWSYLSKVCFLKKLSQFFPLGNSAKITGIHTIGPAAHLIRNGKRIDCNKSNYAPFVVNGLLTSSSSTTPSPTSHHHRHHRIPHLTSSDTLKIQYQKEVEVRVKSFGETRCMNPQKPKTKLKMKDAKNYKEISHELPDWPQEFRKNLVDQSTTTDPWRNPEQGSQDTSMSFHELPMEPRAKMEPGSGKHSVYTHFPKDPNCDI